MAIIVRNTNYAGEVLESFLTLATTGNEMVERGLIRIIPGVEKQISIPRIKMTDVIQGPNPNPKIEDGVGDAVYSEKKLNPHDMLAFFPFLPSVFENIWKPFQPTGELIFEQLPPAIQEKLVQAFLAQFNQELGKSYINGFVDKKTGTEIFRGIIQNMADDNNTIVISTTATTMIGKLAAVTKAIPVTIRNNKCLRLLMSVNDCNQYDEELTEREYKNTDETTRNKKMYKDIKIEDMAYWPDGLIVATLCAPDDNSNLYAAVNLQDDEHAVQVDKLSNSSDYWFFKMKIKVDTNIAFGEEVVALDTRTTGKQFTVQEESISLDQTALTFPSSGDTKNVVVTATGDYTHSAAPSGFTIRETETGIQVVAAANTGTADVTGTIIFTLDSDKTKTATLTLTTAKKA